MTAEVAVSRRGTAELRALVADAQARSADWTADDAESGESFSAWVKRSDEEALR